MADLILRKQDDESWLDAALRMARPYGLEEEITTDYNDCIAAGDDEAHAAFDACYNWDVLELKENRHGRKSTG